MTLNKKQPDGEGRDRIVAEARRNREQREQGYREKALKIYPWICGRCRREFTREPTQAQTQNNPPVRKVAQRREELS